MGLPEIIYYALFQNGEKLLVEELDLFTEPDRSIELAERRGNRFVIGYGVPLSKQGFMF